ncbi:R8 protein [Coemansia sp. RSA 989]|nr:Rec8 like protein-domain-containing protein [Coemansia mojavensis]KAJ1864687.1 R8 protein [Coemansia sp. RSA 989]
MFYSQDLLCRRNGRFGAVWLLATSGGRSRWNGIGNREIAAIDISRTCADIISPPVPLSLRLTSTLLVGLSRALERKLHLLHVDCHSTWTRILSMPWVTSIHGFDPLISAATTVPNLQTITLPTLSTLDYLDSPVGDLIADEQQLHSAKHTRSLKRLGWLEESGVESLESDQFMSSWSSLTIPEPLVHANAQLSHKDNTSSLPYIEEHSNALVSNSDPVSVGSDYSDILGGDDIHFDNEGNLHFPSSAAEVTHGFSIGNTDLGQFLAQTSAENNATRLIALADSHCTVENELDGFNNANKRSWNEFIAEQCAAVDNPSIYHPLSPQPNALSRLEAIENDVIGSWRVCAKRLRLRKFDAAGIIDRIDSSSYASQVTTLWADSCYWSRQMRAKLAAALAKRAQTHMCNRILQAANAMALLPDHDGLRQMLYPTPMPSSDISSPEDPMAYDAFSEVSDLELGRGGSLNAHAFDEEEMYNIDVDIPWLNLEMLKGVQQQKGRSASVQSEASASADALAASGRNSRQSTPASRVSSLDPPSSDEGLEVQSFELAAHNLRSNEHGLDSFLDISTVWSKSKPQDEAHTKELNHEAQCFYQYTTSRMQECNCLQLQFDELLQPEHRTRRIAARAFVDVLQMASCSVFAVSQKEPYAEITISRKIN